MSPASVRRTLRPRAAVVTFTAVAALAAPSLASACSTDNTTYLESFLDNTCLQTPTTNTTLDALGGLRLSTNGAESATTWDTDTHFASGVTFGGTAFPRVGVSTLATNDTGGAASLLLPTTPLPLAPDAASVVGPTASTVPDGDHVDSPSVIRTATGYVMYYVGLGEDGSGPKIYRATSTDGKSWTRVASPNTSVLAGTAGAFDEKGVAGPHVIYDAADPVAPYRMYYAGQGEVFGAIGYATSTDGVNWVKYTGTANPADPPVAVLRPGQGGSADSFAAADPWVVKDGVVWKMWYTADDSNQKRIGYATSTDGIAWQKGGAVVNPGSPAIMQNDAFAPTVWKDGNGTYRMLFGGYNAGSDQTKLVNATSSDGITWSGFGTGMPSAGGSTRFDVSNLNSPSVLDDATATTDRFKLYYSGNNVDANGNAHYRIGLATGSNGSSFSRYSPGTANESVLDIAALGTRFDARSASGLSVALTGHATNRFIGFYAGFRGQDGLWSIGQATSTNGTAWTKSDPGTATQALNISGTAQDDKGMLDPAVLLDGTTYNLFYTGIDAGGVKRVFRASAAQNNGSKMPGAWTAATTAAFAGDGSGFDANGVEHASVIKAGANYVAYYAGTATGAVPEIGRLTSTTADLATSPVRSATPVIAKGAVGSFDEKGAKDPVVTLIAAGDFHMVYTAIDAAGVERLAYATSADGIGWTKQGVVLNPSQRGFANDEVGVRASGMLVDGADVHVYTSRRDRTGRMFGGHAMASPTEQRLPAGWATYQAGDSTTSIRDWRSITRTSGGSGVELWLSFLQPYTIAGQPAWSDYFPVTANTTTETLNLLLTVKGVRWQARLSGPAGSPSLDSVSLATAPVQFFTSGNASTLPIEPPSTMTLGSWNTLTVNTSTFSPAGGGTVSGTVAVQNADTGAQLVAPVALNTNGVTTQSLAAVNAAQNRRLRLVYSFTSDGAATPKVTSATISYAASATPPTPPPPPVDTTAPVNVAITGPSTLSKPFQAIKYLTLSWGATDAESGIAKYELRSREATIGGTFGAPVTVALPTATTTSFKLTPRPGSTFCYSVIATNGQGLSATSPERCTAQPLSSYGMLAQGTWAKKLKTGFYLGRYRTSKTKGQFLYRKSVTAKRIALVATRGKGMGTVTVWLGTTKLKTIKLESSTLRKRQIITIATFTKVKKGTLKVRIETANKPVIIEGIAVSKM